MRLGYTSDTNIFRKRGMIVVVVFFLFSILALMDKSHRQKKMQEREEQTNEYIYSKKRRNNDVEMVQRICNDFFKITPTRKLTPVMFFVRQ
jgi:hypothetical protein